jgi:hypothetical protein
MQQQVVPLLWGEVVLEVAGSSGKEETLPQTLQEDNPFWEEGLEAIFLAPHGQQRLVYTGPMIMIDPLERLEAGVAHGVLEVAAVDTAGDRAVLQAVCLLRTGKAAGAAARTTRTAWAMRGRCTRRGMRACLGSPRRGFRGVT